MMPNSLMTAVMTMCLWRIENTPRLPYPTSAPTGPEGVERAFLGFVGVEMEGVFDAIAAKDCCEVGFWGRDGVGLGRDAEGWEGWEGEVPVDE